MIKIEHTTEPANLDIKRCYLPIVITSTCPECGAEISKHLSSDYLSYPKLNERIAVPMYHCIPHETTDEEHEWKVYVVLHITMEEVS